VGHPGLDLTLFRIFRREGKHRLFFGYLVTMVNLVDNVSLEMKKKLTDPSA
jgi:hypothetical protein